MESKINRIITALTELEARGCHRVYFEYGNRQFRVRIFRDETGEGGIVYEKTVHTADEADKADTTEEICEHVNRMKFLVCKTAFPCYRREFAKGEKPGKWEKNRHAFELGVNATQAMQTDSSGYFIDDPDNGLQYFVDMKNTDETDRQHSQEHDSKLIERKN